MQLAYEGYGGATRERRTPSRCLQGSYAPERWWRGDQPWDRTTFSRASAERYDHTSSLVELEPTAGVEPAPVPYEGAVLPITLRRRWSRLEDSNRDFSGNQPAVLPLNDLSMVGSGGLEPPRACARGRWATDYPTTRRTSWGERPEANRLERVSQTRGAPFAFAHHRSGRR